MCIIVGGRLLVVDYGENHSSRINGRYTGEDTTLCCDWRQAGEDQLRLANCLNPVLAIWSLPWPLGFLTGADRWRGSSGSPKLYLNSAQFLRLPNPGRMIDYTLFLFSVYWVTQVQLLRMFKVTGKRSFSAGMVRLPGSLCRRRSHVDEARRRGVASSAFQTNCSYPLLLSNWQKSLQFYISSDFGVFCNTPEDMWYSQDLYFLRWSWANMNTY